MEIKEEDIRRLEELRVEQLKARKVLFPILMAVIVAFPIIYVTQATTLPRSVLQTGMVIAILAILGVAFITRLALMYVRFRNNKTRQDKRLLEFAEPDDLNMSPSESIIEMEKRRKDSLRSL